MDNRTPADELSSRWEIFRRLLQEFLPEAEGAFVFSRLNIFYFTGTSSNGIFWLPAEGEPVLFCRRGAERAGIETPLRSIVQFSSYADIRNRFCDLAIDLPSRIASEMNALPWALSRSLIKHLPDAEFVPCDKLIAVTRARKSEWELQILREAGRKHDGCLTQLLPPLLHEGISELQIAHRISDLFYSEGHIGVLRMETFGEELFQGHIAIGDSGNYPSAFNGPNGLRGAHPAAPFMGSEEIRWKPGTPLLVDNGFTIAGYQTDKTQTYWLGDRESIPESLQNAHDFCGEMQDMVAEQLRPGAVPSQLWSQCVDAAARSPWENGFMGLGKNKVSFLGHGIGLATDEWPVVAEGFDLPLEKGMTLAIEPKIGIPGVGMVGTENTFEVTESGGQSLTGNDCKIITVQEQEAGEQIE
jgi:Xaa-Pro dipeptidase